MAAPVRSSVAGRRLVLVAWVSSAGASAAAVSGASASSPRSAESSAVTGWAGRRLRPVGDTSPFCSRPSSRGSGAASLDERRPRERRDGASGSASSASALSVSALSVSAGLALDDLVLAGLASEESSEDSLSSFRPRPRPPRRRRRRRAGFSSRSVSASGWVVSSESVSSESVPPASFDPVSSVASAVFSRLRRRPFGAWSSASSAGSASASPSAARRTPQSGPSCGGATGPAPPRATARWRSAPRPGRPRRAGSTAGPRPRPSWRGPDGGPWAQPRWRGRLSRVRLVVGGVGLRRRCGRAAGLGRRAQVDDAGQTAAAALLLLLLLLAASAAAAAAPSARAAAAPALRWPTPARRPRPRACPRRRARSRRRRRAWPGRATGPARPGPGTSSPASASSWGRLSVRSEKCRKQSCFWPTSTKAARMAGMTFWTLAEVDVPDRPDVIGVLDVELDQLVVLDDGDPRAVLARVDDDLLFQKMGGRRARCSVARPRWGRAARRRARPPRSGTGAAGARARAGRRGAVGRAAHTAGALPAGRRGARPSGRRRGRDGARRATWGSAVRTRERRGAGGGGRCRSGAARALRVGRTAPVAGASGTVHARKVRRRRPGSTAGLRRAHATRPASGARLGRTPRPRRDRQADGAPPTSRARFSILNPLKRRPARAFVARAREPGAPFGVPTSTHRSVRAPTGPPLSPTDV